MAVVNFPNCLSFLLESSIECSFRIFEKFFELTVELFVHSLDISDTHGQIVGVANSLDCKLSDHVEFHNVEIIHHISYAHLLLFGRYEEVYFAKMVAIHYVNINNILFERQDKC